MGARFAGRREILVVPQPLFRLPKALVVAWILLRALLRLARFLLLRHPLATVSVAGLLWLWSVLDLSGLAILALLLVVAAGIWRWQHPLSFSRWLALPVLGR